jgi:hypothetical protein
MEIMQGSMLKPTYSKLVFAWGLSGPFMTLPTRQASHAWVYKGEQCLNLAHLCER